MYKITVFTRLISNSSIVVSSIKPSLVSTFSRTKNKMDTDDIDYYLAMEEEVQMEQDEMEPWDDVDDSTTKPPLDTTSAVDGKTALAQVTTPPAVAAKVDFHSKEKKPVATRLKMQNVSQDATVTAKLNSYTAASKSRASNPKDFALAMQAERRKALGESDDHEQGAAARRVVQMDFESTLFTTRTPYYACAQASKFLHDRPPTTAELVDISTDAKGIASGYMPCVLADGSRMYLYKRQRKEIQGVQEFGSPGTKTRDTVGSPVFSKTLLSKPMSELMKEADALKAKAHLMKDAHIAEMAAKQGRDASMDMEADSAAVHSEDGSLWVDKYAPRSFTQLLSPEKINREVLKAVKKWDQFVFKHDHNAADEEGASGATGSATKPPRPPTATATGTGLGGSGADANGEDTRPRNKVILLCGPPGTGKTTLAHIVATHCGYSPMEVNASDDRSPERLKEILHNATQNTTLLAHSRPNCVILDEIDGIDGSRNALDVLVNIVKAPLKHAATTKQKGVSGVFALTRPLICICNDQYAPALRELIKLADVFVFTAPQDVRLIQRLRQVCKAEGLQVGNSSYLSELCSATGFDIRSSINNLQFAALRTLQHQHQHQHAQVPGGAVASAAAVGSGGSHWGSAFGHGSTSAKDHAAPAPKQLDIGSVLQSMIRTGLKDDSLDLSQIWRQMFTINPASNIASAITSAGDGGEDAAPVQSASGRVDHSMKAMDAMLSYGDHQQVIAGIYENVHSIEALDPSMNKRTIIAEWLSFTEELQSFMPRGRDGFQLMPYVAVIAGAVYAHCAVLPTRRPKIEWPRKDKEMHYKGVQKQNILQSVHDASSIHALLTSKQRIVLDMLPYLMDVISPPPTIRALPFITLPAPEQHAITDVVKIMESCGISYTLTKIFDAGAAYKGNNPFKPFRPYGQNNNGSNGAGGASGGGSGWGTQNNELVLMLDPAFDQLLQYGGCEELTSRHLPVSPEMRQILHAEQRKYSIQLKAQKLDTDGSVHHSTGSHSAHPAHSSHKATYSSNFTVPSAASSAHSAAQAASAAANAEMLESTPYLIMQQQQKDSALTKRQHSGAMDSFFKKSTVAPVVKKAKLVAEAEDSAQGAAAPQEKKAVFNANSIRFKFNQGFSNAVKRTVLMDEFL